jgi:hypothetical protein
MKSTYRKICVIFEIEKLEMFQVGQPGGDLGV